MLVDGIYMEGVCKILKSEQKSSTYWYFYFEHLSCTCPTVESGNIKTDPGERETERFEMSHVDVPST